MVSTTATNWKSFLGFTVLGVSVALAKPCVGFDSEFNLYVFGGTTDYSLGSQDGWFDVNIQAKALTVQGRPSFDGVNTQCFLAQFFNALYVLDGDSSQPNAVHIFDFGSKSWTTQTVELNGVSHQSIISILDRDTNALYGLDKGTVYRLGMDELAAADKSKREWEAIGSPPFMGTTNYTQPVLALAQNHIHFLNIGQPGAADIFVIHFAYFQPEVQSYPRADGKEGFPSTHGQTASIFKGVDNVQTKFAFWPDDKSSTYVVDVVSNTTSVMAGPSDKSSSIFSTSQTGLVQLTVGGNLYAMAFSPDDEDGANGQATWKKINIPQLNFEQLSSNGKTDAESGGTKTLSGTSTRVSGSVSPTSMESDGGGGRRMGLSWGMTMAGIALGGIGLMI